MREYNSFYKFVEKHLDKIYILNFNDVIKEPIAVFNIIQENANIKISDSDSINQEYYIKKAFDTINSFKTQKGLKISSVPNEKREIYKEEYKK